MKKLGFLILLVALACCLLFTFFGCDSSSSAEKDKYVDYFPEVLTKTGTLKNRALRSNDYYSAQNITEITFLNTLTAAPAWAWDFSEEQNGSILAWLEETHLYVAGNGSVKAGADAKEMFAGVTMVSALDHASIRQDESKEYFKNLKRIDFNNSFNTSHIVDMSGMFCYCPFLTELDMSGFNTANVTNMRWMFAHCSSLLKIDLSSFETSNVTDMNFMFADCSALTELDLSSFNTMNVTDMRWMFDGCTSLISLDMSNSYIRETTYRGDMFKGTKWEDDPSEILKNRLIPEMPW